MIKPRHHHQNEHKQLNLKSIDQSSRQIERVLTGFNGNWSIRVATRAIRFLIILGQKIVGIKMNKNQVALVATDHFI